MMILRGMAELPSAGITSRDHVPLSGLFVIRGSSMASYDILESATGQSPTLVIKIIFIIVFPWM
jgi:hypothetical protein